MFARNIFVEEGIRKKLKVEERREEVEEGKSGTDTSFQKQNSKF